MTAKEASLTIPFPPTLNHNIGRNGGRYYKDDDYKRFQTQVGWLWLQAVPPLWSQTERYAVAIELIYDSNRRYDVDNRVKPILDALTKAGAWKDDSQVDAILVVRGEIDKDRPRAQVTIEKLKRRGFLRQLRYVLSVIYRFFAGSCDDDREDSWLDELDSEEEYEFEGENGWGLDEE